MFRQEFEALWAERNKCVNEDIAYQRAPGARRELYFFDCIPIICQSGIALAVSGSYSCRTGAITFNFTVEGVGPVTRYCIGGTEHGRSGRYHQHLLRHESCSRRNLPYAEQRLNMVGMSAKKIWQEICTEADINHTGTFFEPEVQCP